jgi:hypothetical protein
MHNIRPFETPTSQSPGAQRWQALLAGLTAFILFPLGWLGAQWPAFGRLLDAVFATDAAHMAGHAALFTLLGLLVLGRFPALLDRRWNYAGLLLAGVGQECFQLLYKQRGLAFDDGRDLLIDLVGLAIAYALARGWRWAREK